MNPVTRAVIAASRSVLPLLESREIAVRWNQPSALADMSIGALAGHVVGALGRTETILDEPEPPAAVVVDVAAYYGANRVSVPADLASGIHPIVRNDGASRAQIGPARLARDFSELIERLAGRLPDVDPSRLVPVIQVRGGASRLEDYLRTRVVELVVHGDDLAASVGTEWEPSTDAINVVLGVFLDLARARSGDLAVMRAFARRERSDPEVLRAL